MGGERPLLPRNAALTRQAYGWVMAIVQWAFLYLKDYHFVGGQAGPKVYFDDVMALRRLRP